VGDFSGGTLSSDGGALLLRQVDASLGVTRTLAGCFHDQRDQRFVDHGMAQLLAHHGLAVGISSGANVIGALKVQQALGSDAIVVTVLCDSNKKYLSTDLLRSEPVKDGYLTPQVEMLGFDSVNRVCEMCADPRT